MSGHWVRTFHEGSAEERDLLGGKGANLAEMTRMGLPVPAGFTVTTDACRSYLSSGGQLPDGLAQEIDVAVAAVEAQQGKRYGDVDDPLLLSVRSGARFSMPGMMDTVLDLGLNPASVAGLARATGDPRFAADSWRRLTEMFSTVVLGVDAGVMRSLRDEHCETHGVDDPSALDADATTGLVEAYRAAVLLETGDPFPDDPRAQLHASVEAVFRSWNGRRARDYRRLEGIGDDLGTAVNVQAMVFGNLGADSGSGVVFTRDPATGEAQPYGDFLMGAQGEDVVAGVRITRPFSELAQVAPECHAQLVSALDTLEARFLDMCDVEFTIERGKLWVLQTRVGKRSAAAALRIAVELVDEGVIEPVEAVRRFSPEQLERLLHPRFDPSVPREVLTTGLAASPGAASGVVCLTADEAVAASANGPVILVRVETSPDDLHGLVAAQGVLTSRGGLVSHAAVVARGLGKPAVCGAADVVIDLGARTLRVGDVTVDAGDRISIDGSSGEVVRGDVPVVAASPGKELERLLLWADDHRRLGVRANADTATDARVARSFGAEGIGLCRTEHMFFGERLPIVQRVILADDEATQQSALEALRVQQHDDFVALFAEMDGLPVTVRLLDPPLHEFLPDVETLLIRRATAGLDADEDRQLEAALRWREHDPMLGVRGVRLGILIPELYRMQVRAVVTAVMEREDAGGDPRVQIMIPLTVSSRELAHAAADVRATIATALGGRTLEHDIHVGTMIETPRAALVANELADTADFFSFGTNDLTQMVFGFSRDDVEARMMPRYLSLGLLAADPFASIDVVGVGRMVRMATDAIRARADDLEVGVCGEHGGDPRSIAFFEDAGLDYVSCSPYRIPVARLSAARAAMTARD